MLDINFIRKNQQLVEKSTREKGYSVDIIELLKLDDQRKLLQQEIDDLRRSRNEIAAQMKGGKPNPELITKGKEVKEQLAQVEPSLSLLEQQIADLIKLVPNIIFDDVPLGGEECSKEVAAWGEKKSSGVDHLDYAISIIRECFIAVWAQKSART